MNHSTASSKSAFTLAEILLAMMVFAIAITTILALLARSIETTEEILLKDEAMNLTSSLEGYMEGQPFEDAYAIVQDASEGAVYAFTYAGSLTDPQNMDGSLAPFTVDVDSVLGEDYASTTLIATPSELGAEKDARLGKAFYVVLTVSPSNPFGTALPGNPDAVAGIPPVPAYNSAILVIFAEFYAVPKAPMPSAWLTNTLPNLRPVFSYTFGVRR